MSILGRLFGGRVRAEMENAIHAISVPLCVYLHRRYTGEFDETTAIGLAVAVTNELFGAPPGNETARQFLSTNGQLVETKLSEIRNVPQICRIVSVALHMRANVAGNAGTVTPQMIASAVKLRKLGVLLPVESLQLPSSSDDLMRQVREFEFWTMKN